MKKLPVFLALFLMFGISGICKADGLQWSIPGDIGTFQLPGSYKDINPLFGYDFIQRQTIAGASATLMTLFHEINGYVGAVGEFHTQAPNLQPYIAIGADVMKYIPGLYQFQSLSLQGFGRYSTSTGGSFEAHLGAGLALAYKFQ